MSRNVPFDKSAKCDECGAVGAFDFMGDYYCPKCLSAHRPDPQPCSERQEDPNLDMSMEIARLERELAEAKADAESWHQQMKDREANIFSMQKELAEAKAKIKDLQTALNLTKEAQADHSTRICKKCGSETRETFCHQCGASLLYVKSDNEVLKGAVK